MTIGRWLCLAALVAACVSADAVENEKNAAEPRTLKLAADEPETPAKEASPKSSSASRWEQAWFRLEGNALTPWHAGSTERRGDVGLRLTLDYEVPVFKHLTVSPRAIPLMYWEENNDGNNHIVAAGLGFSLRGYFKKHEYRGFYAELAGMGIFQSDTFEDNNGWFNFMEEIGVGYVFKSDWSASAKVGHISNAELFEDNAGVNFFALGVGYSFRK